MIVGFHFYRSEYEFQKPQVVLPGEDELEFLNESSLDVKEIMDLVSKKQIDLRNLFYHSNIYEPHQIDPTSYSLEDNQKYVVFDQKFLTSFHDIVTESVYSFYFEQMKLIQNGYYVAPKEIFQAIYLESVIAELDIASSSLRLLAATDEIINASVTLKTCEEDVCEYEMSVPFEIQNINGDWKVSSFVK